MNGWILVEVVRVGLQYGDEWREGEKRGIKGKGKS